MMSADSGVADRKRASSPSPPPPPPPPPPPQPPPPLQPPPPSPRRLTLMDVAARVVENGYGREMVRVVNTCRSARSDGDLWAHIVNLEHTAGYEAFIGCFQKRMTRLMHWSAMGNLARVVQTLDRGADVNVQTRDGRTALLWARYSPDVVRELLVRGADPNAVEVRTGDTCLHHVGAASAADLLRHGADVDPRNVDGDTPLMRASHRGDAALAAVLLSHGANVNAQNKRGWTSLMHVAAESNHYIRMSETRALAILRVLLAAPACDTALVRDDGATAIQLSVCWASTNFRLLLSLGRAAVSSSASAALLDRALAIAAGRGFGTDVVRFVNTTAAARKSAPHWAGLADVRLRGTALLTYAARRGDVARLRALLDSGAAVNERDACGCAALHYAADGGHDSSVRELLDRGADVSWATEGDARTALHLAATNGHGTVVAALVAGGAAVDARDRHGATPLALACLSSRDVAVAELLRLGADVNAVDADGMTPLMVAVAHGRAAGRAAVIATLLAVPGVDVNRAGPSGKTALAMAITYCRGPLITVLRAAGAI